MTGNVAQVFLDAHEFIDTLKSISNVLVPNGQLIFEARDPKDKAWLNWNKESSYTESFIDGLGQINSWVELTEHAGPLVSFRWNYYFVKTKKLITSDSTIIFRDLDQTTTLIKESGFEIIEISDAPDRPGKEHIFYLQKNNSF